VSKAKENEIVNQAKKKKKRTTGCLIPKEPKIVHKQNLKPRNIQN